MWKGMNNKYRYDITFFGVIIAFLTVLDFFFSLFSVFRWNSKQFVLTVLNRVI